MSIRKYNLRKYTIRNNIDDKEEENDDALIRVVNNHIYFYSPVNTNSAIELNTTIHNVSTEIIKRAADYGTLTNTKFLGLENTPIYLHINSEGGEVMAAMSIVDTILNNKVPITSIIEGSAASAATLISIVCHHRQIHTHAMMLIHQISGGFWGKMNEFEDEMKNMKLTMKIVKKLYKQYGNIPEVNLDTVLKKDIWWNSKKCLKLGLVDEFIN